MSRSDGRPLAVVTILLGILAGVAVFLLGVSILYVGETTTGDHPLDDVVPLIGMIVIVISICLSTAVGWLSRSIRSGARPTDPPILDG